MIWLMMRQAALMRQRIVVEALYAPGPARDAAWARHVLVVQSFYGF